MKTEHKIAIGLGSLIVVVCLISLVVWVVYDRKREKFLPPTQQYFPNSQYQKQYMFVQVVDDGTPYYLRYPQGAGGDDEWNFSRDTSSQGNDVLIFSYPDMQFFTYAEYDPGYLVIDMYLYKGSFGNVWSMNPDDPESGDPLQRSYFTYDPDKHSFANQDGIVFALYNNNTRNPGLNILNTGAEVPNPKIYTNFVLVPVNRENFKKTTINSMDNNFRCRRSGQPTESFKNVPEKRPEPVVPQPPPVVESLGGCGRRVLPVMGPNPGSIYSSSPSWSEGFRSGGYNRSDQGACPRVRRGNVPPFPGV